MADDGAAQCCVECGVTAALRPAQLGQLAWDDTVQFVCGDMCEADLIDREDLPTSAHGDMQNGSIMALIPGITMSELERIAILRTLDAVDGSTARAAEILGISQRKIQYRVKEWGYQAPTLE